MTTDLGAFKIELWPDVAPNHVHNFIALAQGGGMPPPWITYSPLLPLALLLLTGLYMFVLPYAAKWRSWRRGDVRAAVLE